MLLNVLDASGLPQKAIVHGQEVPVDYSGTVAATGVSQQAVAANVLRSGLLIQNLSATSPLYVEERGVPATATTSVMLAPGAFLPANMPVTASAINILGTAGQPFLIREW